LGIGQDILRDQIKHVFSAFGPVAFVDNKKSEGFVRFQNAESAAKALQELKQEFGGVVPTLRLLEGQEEETYWASIIDSKPKGRSFSNGKRKQPGSRGGWAGSKRKKLE